jgi:hypothetical protein
MDTHIFRFGLYIGKIKIVAKNNVTYFDVLFLGYADVFVNVRNGNRSDWTTRKC